MKRIVIAVSALIMIADLSAFCSGSAESSSSSGRGEYLASRGIIIPPKDIYPESYISQIDYDYPNPSASPVGLAVYPGNRQIGSDVTREWIQIGLKGRKIPFEELPPLNLVFVIDKSGSMYDANKMSWVKEGLNVFLSKVRAQDYVSLVAYSDDAQVVFPSTRMDQAADKTRFKQAVLALKPGGRTNMLAGLTLGYRQALVNFRSDYTNRVLFLTDGLAERQGLLEMADSYMKRGISCSTIGVGASFNTALMMDLAAAGGGSSRFISDKAEMERTFSTELDRMVVAAARNLTVDLRLLNGATLLDTWGYQHQRDGDTVHYSLPTLHNGDYETILAEVALPRDEKPVGAFTYAEVRLSYDDSRGSTESLAPVRVSSRVVGAPTPVYSVSDPNVLRSSTMLELARSLIRIGTLYYSAQPQGGVSSTTDASAATAPELKEALELTIAARKRLQNTRQLLNDARFDDEIGILERYVDILGAVNRVEAPKITEMKKAREITPPVQKRSLDEHLRYMFDEVVLSLPHARERSIAVPGFSFPNDRTSPILDVLNERARKAMGSVSGLTVVDRTNVDTILRRQKLTLPDLLDTSNAIKVGRLSAAQWVLTGAIIEMPQSIVLFVRVIDVQSGEIISVSQELVQKADEIGSLL